MPRENVPVLIPFFKSFVHTYYRKVKGKLVAVKEHLDSRIPKHEYIAKLVKDASAKKFVAMPKVMPTIFASGTNDAGEIRGMRDAGIPVGTVADELENPEALREIEDLAGTGLPVFVDSGAFSEVTEQKDGPPIVTKPIPDAEWKKRLALYLHLAKTLGPQLYVVAPDQIANQQMTLWRLRQYAKEMQAVHAEGANVMVALQGGAMDRITFYRRATEAIGFQAIPCFPMKKAPASKESIVEFMRVVKPPRVHFLGMGIRGKNTAEILDAVAEASPTTKITIDANLISGHVGVDPKTGKASSSRTLTAAQDAIINWGFEDGFGETLNSEWDIHEDGTEAIHEPSGWAGPTLLEQIAKDAQLSPEETKAFLKDPDGFLQEPSRGDGSPDWYEHPLMAIALDTAWMDYLKGVHTHARKHEAMPYAFQHHPAFGQFPGAKDIGMVNQKFGKKFGSAS